MTISLGFWLVSTVATAVLSAVAACCAMRWLGAARPSSAADAHPPGHRPCAASLTFAPVAFCSAPSAPKADAGSTVQLLLAQLAARGDLLGLRWLTSLGDQLSGWPAPQYTAQLSTPMSSLPAASPPATCAEFAREQQPGCPEKIPPSSTGSKSADGELVLVGAGPGHVSLLTLAALAAIAEADLVVADRLIPAETLRLCRGQLVVAQKEYGRAHVAQEEIHAACLKGLQRGWRVVRLKGGDPFVFGRGGEELLHFRQLGYRVRVVPGISSSLSAPLLAGIPVTHRGIADQILVATAHGKDDSDPHFQPYSPNRTDVFMMGALRLTSLSRKLREQYGYPASTPVAIIENASLPQQRQLFSTLERVAEDAEAQKIAPPSVILVGRVAGAFQPGLQKDR